MRRLAAVGVVLTLWLVGSAAGQTPAGDDPWNAVAPRLESGAAGQSDASLLVRRPVGGEQQALRPRQASSSGSWWRTAAALAGVVGLIVFLAWGYRTATSGGLQLWGRQRQPGLIEVLSRVTLGPRQSVCLLRIGPRMVLVGQSGDGLRTLDVIDDADLTARLAGQALTRRSDSSTAEFRQVLKGQARQYRKTTTAPPADEPQLDRVRQNVLEAIERLRRAGAAR